MENLIKKNFMIQKDKLSQFAEENPVQQTLREQIEEINQELNDQQKKNKALRDELFSNNKDSENKNQYDQAKQIETLTRENQFKDSKLQDLSKQLKTMESHQHELRRQLKEAEEKNQKNEIHYKPRLLETQKFQKEIYAELERIRLDSDLLPSMFQAEAVQSKKWREERDSAIQEMQKALSQHNQLTSAKQDLQNEVLRKERLSTMAMAARSEMKHYLDEAKAQNKDLQRSIDHLQNKVIDGEIEVTKFKNKHDEMFASVSGLNARIEELEQHKLHLLQQLKKTVSILVLYLSQLLIQGNVGDLSYIVKTQKLDDIQTKEMQNRVQLEDYKPEKNRPQRDKDYADQQAKLDAQARENDPDMAEFGHDNDLR